MSRTFLASITSCTLLLSACGNSGNVGTFTNSEQPVQQVPSVAATAPAYEPPAMAPAPTGVVARENDSNQIIGFNGTTTGPEGATKESAPGNIKSIGVDGADVGKPSD